MILSRLILLMMLSLLYAAAAYANKPIVSIIIDDMGYRLDQDRMALELEGSITYAVLPNTPNARHVIETANKMGNELMLHLPMEPANREYLPSRTMLTRSMNWVTFVSTVQDNLAAVPGVVAVNNHEGSLLTADYQRMKWLAEELSHHRGIAFIDSRTTSKTVALKAARERGLPATYRDVFLDHAPGKIAQQFNKLISVAKRKGSALAIAHPYKHTINFLKRNLHELNRQGVELVPVSRLIEKRQTALIAAGGGSGKSIGSISGRL